MFCKKFYPYFYISLNFYPPLHRKHSFLFQIIPIFIQKNNIVKNAYQRFLCKNSQKAPGETRRFLAVQ